MLLKRSGTFQHPHPAGRFNNYVRNIVSMKHIGNGRDEGGMVSCTKTTFRTRPHITAVLKSERVAQFRLATDKDFL